MQRNIKGEVVRKTGRVKNNHHSLKPKREIHERSINEKVTGEGWREGHNGLMTYNIYTYSILRGRQYRKK